MGAIERACNPASDEIEATFPATTQVRCDVAAGELKSARVF